MTKSEYRELVAFMAPRFDELKSRLEGVENRLTRVEVSVEDNRHRIQVVAEGVTTVDGKLERFRGEVAEEFRAVRGEMASGFRAVRGEMASEFEVVREEMASEFRAVREEMASGFAGVRDRFELQDASLRDLGARMDRWEGG